MTAQKALLSALLVTRRRDNEGRFGDGRGSRLVRHDRGRLARSRILGMRTDRARGLLFPRGVRNGS